MSIWNNTKAFFAQQKAEVFRGNSVDVDEGVKINSLSSILVLDDFSDYDDNYISYSNNDIIPLQGNNPCCDCTKNIYVESWWYYHDSYNILLRNISKNTRKIICCNHCSNIFQFTYKFYSMNTYIECCCVTCLTM